MIQLLCHLWGDYIIQTSWMALNKEKNTLAAFIHALTYTLCFLFITTNTYTLLTIGVTHFIIDRFALVKRLRKYNGPDFLSVWLSIIADNTIHLTINFLAITYIGI